MGALAVAGKLAAQEAKPDHEHHAMPGKNGALIAAAHHCMAAGDLCTAHCIDMLAAGDKSLKDCAKSVAQMRAMIGALAQLAAQNAPHLKEMAALCAKACRDCEAECKKHEQHPPCKACGEACNKCAAECDKTAA
jgi:Cys-rich four helix bundle protein (predicted Tat secretion target)